MEQLHPSAMVVMAIRRARADKRVQHFIFIMKKNRTPSSTMMLAREKVLEFFFS